MTKRITVNYENETIEITKQFNRKACIPNTDEYRELKSVRNEFPTFTVIISSANSRRKGTRKGLTYEVMESYIDMIDDIEAKSEFQKKKELAAKKSLGESYGTIRKWFLDRYPEINKAA